MRYLIMCAFFCFLSGCDPEEDAFIQKRRLMVENQIKARGIKDEKVLKAMLETRRDLFVPKGLSELAYQDNAFPIGDGQTISQPYIVALMTELAKVGPQSKVLEIGTGSGYQSAILSKIAKSVYSIELIKELADNAKKRLYELGYKNVEIKHGDGYRGWPEEAPFDAIIITAAAPEIPKELIDQLKTGGKMIIPIGDFIQELYVITKQKDGSIKKESIIPVRFVPLIKGKPQKE